MSNIFNYKKTVQAINYLVEKLGGGEVNYLKVMKLLYFADRFSIRKYGALITSDNYFAMKFGPALTKTMNMLKGQSQDEAVEYYSNEYVVKNGNSIKSIKAVDSGILSEVDIEALDFAISNYGGKDGFALADLSHEYPEWKKHANSLKVQPREEMSFEDFFLNPDQGIVKNDPFTVDEKILAVSRKIFADNLQTETLLR